MVSLYLNKIKKMRKILIISIFILSSTGFAQNKNFVIENNLIVWKFIYDDSTNVSELKNNPRLEFKTDSTGYIKKTNFEDKKLNQLTGEFKIESKKGKYRVSVYNMKFYVEPITLNSSSISMQTITEFSIEKSLIKSNGSIRESYFGYNLTETLNPHLVRLFTIIKNVKSDW